MSFILNSFPGTRRAQSLIAKIEVPGTLRGLVRAREFGFIIIAALIGALGKINIDDLITHTMPLEKINDGFDLMTKGQSIRSVVLY